VNRLSLTVGIALMDTCWVAPWAVLLALWSNRTDGGGLLSPLTLLALILLGAWTTHLFGQRARTGRMARIGLASLGAIGAVTAVRVDLFSSAGAVDWILPMLGALASVIGHLSAPAVAFALALYLWWRGVRLGAQTPSFVEVESAFRWGIGRLAVFGLVLAVTTRPSVLPPVEAQTTPYIVGFFFVSLVTLALGRLESLRTRTRNPTLNSQWLGVLILVAGAVVLLALLVAQLVSFDVLFVATRPLFDLLGEILLLLIYIIVIPLSWIIQWLIYLLLSLLQPDLSRQRPEFPQPLEVDNFLQRFFAEQVPPELLIALKAVGAALLLGAALLIVARAFARWRPSSSDADATNEERDSLWNTARMWSLVLAWLRRLLRRGVPAGVVTPGVPSPVPEQVGAALELIRALYVQLLKQGESAGAPRAASTTPFEHAVALTRRLAPDEAVIDLTEAYVRARYAEVDVAQAETDALRVELEQVHPKSAVDQEPAAY
jgi:hypothetical protein